MKILFFCDGLEGGGKERRLVQLLKGLSDRHYGDLHLLMLRDVLAYPEIKQYDVKIEYICRHKPGSFFRILQYLHNLNPDIIQSWEFMPMAYYLLMRPLSLRIPSYSISTAADCNFYHKSLMRRFIYKLSYHQASFVVGNSLAGLVNYQVPLEKRLCIYNGFDENRLDKDKDVNIRAELRIKSKYIVTMMARFTESKDWFMFISAAKKLIDDRVDACFLAVGDGESRQRIMNSVEHKYKDRILFLGRRSDVEAILRNTDIAVLCSNAEVHGEGVSNSILEACAFGIPVVATKGGGTSEIIDDGVNGVLITPHDSISLVEKIRMLLGDDTLRKKMGENGQNTVKEKFSLAKAADEYIKLFCNSCQMTGLD